MITDLAYEIAQAAKPDVAIAAPTQIDVHLPEFTAHQAQQNFTDNLLARFKRALRNNTQDVMSTIREELGM